MRWIRVTEFAAIVIAALTIFGGVFGVVDALDSDTLTISADVSEPVPGITSPDASTLSNVVLVNEFTRASLQTLAPSLGLRLRLLILFSVIVTTVSWVVVALAVALLCARLREGRPFMQSATRAVWAAAASIALGSLATQLLLGWAGMLAVTESGLNLNLGFTVGSAPIIAGLLLGLIATAFRYGERLQRDTEGLV